MSKPSGRILPDRVFSGLANWGCRWLRMFAVYRAQCLKSRKTEHGRPGWRRAWISTTCLCFVALTPLGVRSQTSSTSSTASISRNPSANCPAACSPNRWGKAFHVSPSSGFTLASNPGSLHGVPSGKASCPDGTRPFLRQDLRPERRDEGYSV